VTCVTGASKVLKSNAKPLTWAYRLMSSLCTETQIHTRWQQQDVGFERRITGCQQCSAIWAMSQ
jgi:hypothetical protein